MSNAARIWLTRPQLDSETQANLLGLHGIPSIISPVMRIEPLHAFLAADVGSIKGILITSRHAAHALSTLAEFIHLPIFCVGAATAQKARDAGFKSIFHGTSDVLELIPLILQTLPRGASLLYLAGEETRVDVGVLLKPHGVQLEKRVTYTAHAATELSDELLDALRANVVCGVSFLSVRSAEIAIGLLKKYGITPHAINAYCLSLPIAQAAAGLGWKSIHACAIPTLTAMHELIVSRSAPEVL
jgi:uroporphyrinogen-III synthase